MDTFLGLPRKRQAELCELAADEVGCSPGAIEKDFWVCWVLRELFRSDAGAHLTFKGGTSLSKGWELIARFSEDVDLVVDRGFLGFTGELAPEAGDSRGEQQRRADAVLAKCQSYVGGTLLPALGALVRARFDDAAKPSVELDLADDDRQTILLRYERLFPKESYLSPFVKIELGARSDTEPSREPSIIPYLARVPGASMQDAAFTVRAVAPERTFWEKVSLLHEESFKAKGPRGRLARHYYDLWCLEHGGIATSALAMPDLFERVAEHRRLFFRGIAEGQRSLAIGSVRLVPSAERLPVWRGDFESMRDTMFFEDPPTFDMIMATAADLERRINALPQTSSTPGGAS
jgi:hypothetical protein